MKQIETQNEKDKKCDINLKEEQNRLQNNPFYFLAWSREMREL